MLTPLRLRLKLTHGRGPLVVNCGPGDSFGCRLRRAGGRRYGRSHSGCPLGDIPARALAEAGPVYTSAEALIELPDLLCPWKIGSGPGMVYPVSGAGITDMSRALV